MSDTTLGLASTAVGLVNGTITLLKEARTAAKRSEDHDLKDKLSEVYDSILELKEVVFSLKEENAALRVQLKARQDLKWDTHRKLYFAADDPDPFCPACVDRDSKQMRLQPSCSGGKVVLFTCVVCGSRFGA